MLSKKWNLSHCNNVLTHTAKDVQTKVNRLVQLAKSASVKVNMDKIKNMWLETKNTILFKIDNGFIDVEN